MEYVITPVRSWYSFRYGVESPTQLAKGIEMEELLRSFKLKAACLRVMDLARKGNRYFDQAQPWKTAKTNIDKCALTIYYSIQFTD